MEYKISNENGFPTVTISKMEAGTKLYAERNSCIACSRIYNKERDGEIQVLTNGVVENEHNTPTNKGYLERRRLMATELEGEDYTPEQKPTPLTRWFANFEAGVKQTIDRKRIGERSYVLYHALRNNQKVTFRSCFPGEIMAWNARPLASGEVYVKEPENENDHVIVKSVHRKLEAMRPHGTLLAVRGSFLVADLKVSAKVYHTGDVNVNRFSETKDSFQKFTGNGNVFLEVNGNMQEIPLYPHETVEVFPGYLLAFTDSVSLSMEPAGDVALRNEENNDYVIRLTANEKGGYVYTHSVKRMDFFGLSKEFIKKVVKECLPTPPTN